MFRLRPFAICVAVAISGLALCGRTIAADAEESGIRAPEGFEVSLYAGDELAHDIFSMTLDSQGRVVVAGQGYIKTLHDDDCDGRADRATQFAERPKSGAHGMLFLGSDLLCTGDDSLMLLRDADGDGKADGEPEVWAKVRHPEHGANGLTRGPDGWIYLICGNDAGVTSSLAATDGSPVKQPQCGAVVRFSPDGKRSEIVAHGFRNPYDLDFNSSGQLFTVDADGERDHHLPWYAPTRLFDVAQGMHHGWVLQGWQRSWNRPPWMFDNVPRLAEIGRGSPTGLTVYRHRQFPEHYRDSVLTCCWTLGRVYCLPLAADGASYTTEPEVFLETTGEVGFAPVDIAVGPAGDLFIAIGGRRTRGSVFRVRYIEADRPSVGAGDALAEVLNAPQPQAAWSRAEWEERANDVGRGAFVEVIKDNARRSAERVRAMEVVTDCFGGLKPNEFQGLINTDDAGVAARLAWAVGRCEPSEEQVRLLAAATRHAELRVQRAAWESLGALPEPDEAFAKALEGADWQAGMNASDRRVRAAALLADARRGGAPDLGDNETDLWRRHFRGQLEAQHFDAAAEVFLAAPDDRTRLNAVRLMELALGDIDTQQMQADVYAGYSLSALRDRVAAAAERYGRRLAASFPGADNDLNREWARLLGMLGVADEALLDRLSQLWTETSSPQDDVHYLIVASRLPGKRSEAATLKTASALAGIHSKMRRQELHVSRNWPQRVGEAVAQLYRHDPALAKRLIEHEAFRSPAQAFFAEAMAPEDRLAAARKLMGLPSDSGDEETRWTEELVQMIAELPNDEALPALRMAWEDITLRDAIIAVLARARQAEDRQKFVEMLGSVQPRSVELSAAALTMLSGPAESGELLAAMSALKQACSLPEQRATRQAIAHLLAHWTDQSPTIDETATRLPLEAYQPWFEWFATAHPEAAARLKGLGGADTAQWLQRLAEINSDEADAERGAIVFQKKSCVRCHAGNSPLGPDLAGAAGRFSREDLLIAIVDPHKDVSPLYQTTQVVTGSGRTYNGLVVYESPDGTLLQTAPDTTIRITGDEIVLMRKGRVSLMPSGLLNGVADQELVDLLAYMKTLKGKR